MEKKKAIVKIESFSSKDGLLLLSARDYGIRAMLGDFIGFLMKKHNGYVKLEMSAPYPQRTLLENAKWWAMCTELGNYLGMTKDDVSIGIKYRAVDEGLWEAQDVPFSKTGRRMPASTAESDTRQMAVLIEVLYRVAAEYGYEFSE